jgi:hypothetical protein
MRKPKQSPSLESLADQLEAEIDAALGVSVPIARIDGKETRISDDEAQALRDGGRGGEIQRVWLKEPDSSRIMRIIERCPRDIQDRFDEQLRRHLRTNPEALVKGIKHMRRVAADPAAVPADRALARETLKRHGFDDASLAEDD